VDIEAQRTVARKCNVDSGSLYLSLKTKVYNLSLKSKLNLNSENLVLDQDEIKRKIK